MLNYQRVRSQSCELRVFTSQYIVSPRCFQYRRKAPNFFEHGCYGGWLTSGCSSAVLGHDRSCWSLMQRRKWSSITGATWHWNRTTIGQSLLVARRSNHFTGPQILVLYRFFFSTRKLGHNGKASRFWNTNHLVWQLENPPTIMSLIRRQNRKKQRSGFTLSFFLQSVSMFAELNSDLCRHI